MRESRGFRHRVFFCIFAKGFVADIGEPAIFAMNSMRFEGKSDFMPRSGPSATAAPVTLVPGQSLSVDDRHDVRILQDLLQKGPDIVWVADSQSGQMLYVSPAYERIIGRRCSDAYAAPAQWLLDLHPDDVARFSEAPEEWHVSENREVHFRAIRPDGGVVWLGARGVPIQDSTGRVVRIVGVARDLTERKRLEERFAEATAAYKALVA